MHVKLAIRFCCSKCLSWDDAVEMITEDIATCTTCGADQGNISELIQAAEAFASIREGNHDEA